MPLRVVVRASVFSALLVTSAGSVGAAPAASPPNPAPLAGAASGATIDVEQVRRGIVQVERSGRPVAIGTVLSKDGRVLTSLSALGALESPEIRYVDNSVVQAKIGHVDKAWDLALLVPQTGKWLDGLMPTDTDPKAVELRTFLPKAGKLAPSKVHYKGRTAARTKEGDSLSNLLDLDLKGLSGVAGAPLLDPNGKVVGVLVRACKDGDDSPSARAHQAAPCSPVTLGAPVSALRTFLMKTPADAVQPAPWLGLGGAPSEAGNVKGVRVVGVAPGSPAEKAGLSASGEEPDTIVAVDGQPVETPEQLAEVIAKRAVGQSVKLLVFSQGRFREAAVILRAAP